MKNQALINHFIKTFQTTSSAIMQKNYLQLHFVLIVSALILGVSCTTKEKTTKTEPIYIGTGELISIDYSIEEYKHLESYTQDTLLESGWLIEYFVKDDSTRFRDIYLRWSKDGKEGFDAHFHVLELPTYFIPDYIGENNTHVFLEYGRRNGLLGMSTK